MDFERDTLGFFGDWSFSLVLKDSSLERLLDESDFPDPAKQSLRLWAESARANYEAIAFSLHTGYDLDDGSQLHDLHRLRVETCFAIIQGNWQGAVSTTNILLEMFLKLALIYSNIDDASIEGPPLTKIAGGLSAPSQKFRQAKLNDTINMARKQGLIDDATADNLHSFRKQFRNAFFHADMQSMFGDETTPATGADFGTFEIEHAAVPINGIPFLWGEAMWQNAKANAIPYFREVDAMIRKTLPKVFPNSSRTTNEPSEA